MESYPLGEQVASDPLVQVVDDFVTVTERTHIIELSVRDLDTALVSADGPPITSAGRTGSVAWIKHDATPTVHGLVRRVSRLVGIPIRHAESLQVVHYAEAQEYKPHFDAYDMTTEKGRQRTARGGQRIVTTLMYLNDVEAGGATTFPELGLDVEPRPGRMVIFHDVADPGLQDMTRHPRSLHGGAPVRSGQKWACNLWFRARPWQPAQPR
jgi:prolyl 4-hydroxylase